MNEEPLTDEEVRAKIAAMTWGERWALVTDLEKTGDPTAIVLAKMLREDLEAAKRELN
jgi:hypothetical protein